MGRFLFATLFPHMHSERFSWAVQSRFVLQGWTDHNRWELL